MVICKYFQTNSCRYGSRCRFEHVREYSQNPYVYDVRFKTGTSVLQRDPNSVNLPPVRTHINYATHPTTNKRDEIIGYLELMALAVNQVENEHMWPLTSYGILKNHGSIPGWTDYSPEELRWEAYRCQKEGLFDDYVMGVKILLNKASEVRSIFVRPTKAGETIIRDHLNHPSSGESAINVKSSQPLFNKAFQKSAAYNSFSFTLNQVPSSDMNYPPPSRNTFTLGSSPSFRSNVEPSIFGKKETNIFGQGAFPQMMFESEQAMHEDPVPQNSNNLFRTNLDTSYSHQKFGSETHSRFNSVQTSGGEITMYTPMANLSQNEIEQFQANTFAISKIPIKPPPKELCH